jgi:hypothetical protein
MNDNNNRKFFEYKIAKNPEILIAYRIYFIFLDREEFYTIENNEIFFEKVCNYFIENSIEGNIGILIILFLFLFINIF